MRVFTNNDVDDDDEQLCAHLNKFPLQNSIISPIEQRPTRSCCPVGGNVYLLPGSRPCTALRACVSAIPPGWQWAAAAAIING